jgi:hypothetical protein
MLNSIKYSSASSLPLWVCRVQQLQDIFPFGLQLRHADTTTSTSQLQTASGGSMGKNSEKYYIFEPSVCLIADVAQDNIPMISGQKLTVKLI